MRIKKFLIFILILSFALSFVSCSSRKSDNESVKTAPSEITAKNPVQTNYQLIAPNDLPSEAKLWFDSFGNKTQGAFVYQHPDFTVIKVNAGEKPTGGYGINVKSFDSSDTEKKLTVEFIQPAKDAVVTQALTYPVIYVKVPSDNISSYTVVDTTEKELTVKDKSVIAVLYSPVVNSKVVSPAKVKGKIAVFEGTFIVRILDANKKILKEETLHTNGAPAWGPFDNNISFPNPTTPDGYVEVGEYSAKDGSYVLHSSVKVKF